MTPDAPGRSGSSASCGVDSSFERLNRDCFCITLDRPRLLGTLAHTAPALASAFAESHPHLFSQVSFFLSRAHFAAMRAAVEAIEALAGLPGYVGAALADAPDIARLDPGTRGVFMGYDFHLAADGPRLIEVNTNAGGAFLNAVLAGAQRACCAPMRIEHDVAGDFATQVVEMFRSEWRLQRGSGTPRSIAIVDDAPQQQYLYPEFVLAQQQLAADGCAVHVVDPRQLRMADGQLLADGRPVDMVYNRLVDFWLEEADHAVLREAYGSDAAVVTPHPRAYALLADKRNLVRWSDAQRLRGWGLRDAQVDALQAVVPRTIAVTHEDGDRLWRGRRDWFFKPVSGHGSKGVYRGAKLTRGVFQRIVEGGYVAQAYAAPSERVVRVDGADVALKADVRLYTYAGRVLLKAARLYAGQATNLRTPGGGFAPVFEV